MEAWPLSMLYLSLCLTSLIAFPLSMLYLSLCFTILSASLCFYLFSNVLHFSTMRYLSRCFASFSVFYLFLCFYRFQCLTSIIFFSLSHIVLPLWILHLSLLFTSLNAVPLSVLYLFLYLTSFNVVFCITDFLTNFLWVIWHQKCVVIGCLEMSSKAKAK